MTRARYCCRWYALAAACLPAFAGADAVSDRLHQCAREGDEAQRLACFDAIASALPKLETDQFGMTAEIAQKRSPGTPLQGNNETVTTKIIALREDAHGRLLFTLDNSQVWLQTEFRPGTRFAVGDAVRLEHGAMSSLWIAADHDRKTRVRRIS